MKDRLKDKRTKSILEGATIKGFSQDLIRKAKIKIIMVMSANQLGDLKVPPSNELEKLKAERKGQYSIRVNAKYRICFDWEDKAVNIEFVDYH